MVRTLKIAAAFAFAAAMLSCSGIYTHSPDMARQKAGDFLNTLYHFRDYNGALAMTTTEFRENSGLAYLQKTADSFLQKYGKFEGLHADNYFTEQGSRDITVFYTAVSDGAITYHRVTLNGDSSGGYRVSGLVVSDMDFRQGYRLLRKFKGE
ncbi:MAG: hypothetical protein LLG37_07260 [Spirochaetia bacterium]|nr:hypothetical protein [Spirochaetia bacterium]